MTKDSKPCQAGGDSSQGEIDARSSQPYLSPEKMLESNSMMDTTTRGISSYGQQQSSSSQHHRHHHSHSTRRTVMMASTGRLLHEKFFNDFGDPLQGRFGNIEKAITRQQKQSLETKMEV